ncbi:MAG: tetratricopeptide repeat protein [Microcystis sp. LE19-338.1B]|nr:tetratricopeptide repeat protein [Microcystis sp. LE19-338.1B]MCZ8359636.1 tetratricopeptide repeat protein [Microcystis sp. LE19-388.1G]
MYYSQGRYTEAEPLYREAIKIATQVLGDNHPDTQTIMENLKLCCRNSDKQNQDELEFKYFGK